MTDAASFCRLVLGPGAAAEQAAEVAGDGPDRVAVVAAAWEACGPELERRSTTLTWDQGATGLAALPDLERAALAAQALGLTPTEVEEALGTGPGSAPGLLARGHAALAGLGLPADEEAARGRERLATGDRSGAAVDPDFAAVVAAQRRELARLVRGDGPGRAPRSPAALLEPASRPARIAVLVATLALAGAAGFGLVSAFEREPSAGDGVVTATPVGPLPPGVGPTGP